MKIYGRLMSNKTGIEQGFIKKKFLIRDSAFSRKAGQQIMIGAVLEQEVIDDGQGKVSRSRRKVTW